MKRKFLSLVTGVCVLFGIMCVGCSNGSSDGISDDVSVKLEERLKSAKSGETIDIIAENIIYLCYGNPEFCIGHHIWNIKIFPNIIITHNFQF